MEDKAMHLRAMHLRALHLRQVRLQGEIAAAYPQWSPTGADGCPQVPTGHAEHMQSTRRAHAEHKRRAYEVAAIKPGQGNGLEYSAAVLQGALRLFEGVTVFVDHAGLQELWSATGNRSLRNVLGVLTDVSWQDQAIRGILQVYPGEDAEWFCAMVDQYLADKKAGRDVPNVGLSAVLDVKVRPRPRADGTQAEREVVEIGRVVSVDVVFDPARGGEFVRAVNQRSQQIKLIEQKESEGGNVEEEVKVGAISHLTDGETLFESPVQAARSVKEEVKVGAIHELPVQGEEAPRGVREMSTPRGVHEMSTPRGVHEMSTPREVHEMSTPREVHEMSTQALAVSEMLLEMRLQATKLPEPLKAMIRRQHCGQVFDVAVLDRDIDQAQSAWAASLAESQAQVRNVGHPAGARPHGSGTFGVGLNEADRLQAVMDKLCGLQPKSELLQGVRPVSGIRELYLMVTGDYQFAGVYDKERVSLANVTTSTMTSLVKNAFNKVILDYWNQVIRWWEPIASHEDFASMKDMTLITLGGFENLPTVAEGAAYTELSWSDAEEVVAFVKKGAYVGVTLEMMDKDETRKFRAIPRKLAMAGYRTLAALVSALFTDNSGVGPYWPASQSTDRLFCSNYGNLGSSALSASTWDACIQAMYKQAEATSSARMGVRPAYLMVPIELEKTALTIMLSQGEPGTADNDANVRRASSRVIVVPEWTDTNNWAAIANPLVWPGIVIGYRYGRAPEVFIAGEQTVGSMFTNDEMRVKARFIVAVGVGDYRPLYKANV